MRFNPALALLLILMVGVLSSCEREDPPPEAGPTAEGEETAPGVSPALIAQGEELYTGGVCIVCHGSDAAGTQLGPSLRDGRWNRIDGEPEDIARVIRDGLADPGEYLVPMPPLGGGDFDEDDVRALAAYLYQLNTRR